MQKFITVFAILWNEFYFILIYNNSIYKYNLNFIEKCLILNTKFDLATISVKNYLKNKVEIIFFNNNKINKRRNKRQKRQILTFSNLNFPLTMLIVKNIPRSTRLRKFLMLLVIMRIKAFLRAKKQKSQVKKLLVLAFHYHFFTSMFQFYFFQKNFVLIKFEI